MELHDYFLAAAGLLSTAYGVYMLCRPRSLADTPGIVAQSPVANAELRAVFGGIHAGVGVLQLLAVLYTSLVIPALLCVVAVTGGTGAGRLAGVFVDADRSSYTLGLTAFELAVAAFAFLIWQTTLA